MQRKDISITIALCVSLVAHGVGMIALTEYEIRVQTRAIHQDPFDLLAWLKHHQSAGRFAMAREEITPPLPEAPQEPKIPPQIEYRELFGERGSKGKAINSSPGELLLQGQRADEEQASLTTNPGAIATDAGNRGQGGGHARPPSNTGGNGSSPAMVMLPFGPPVDAAAPFGAPPAPAPPLMPPKPFQKPQSEVIGIPIPSPDPFAIKSDVAMDHSPATQPTTLKPTTRPTELATASPTTSPVTDAATTQPVKIALKEPRPEKMPLGEMPTTTQPTLVKVATTKPVREAASLAIASIGEGMHTVEAFPPAASPGGSSHSAGGEAGNKSESESDPFSIAEALVYRDGKVVARNGRKAKTVRPKLTDAGREAAISMDQCYVILGVKIDVFGKVTSVDILRKSGSNEVDLPSYRAMYEWEFEPSKDKDGHAKTDAFVITLNFQ